MRARAGRLVRIIPALAVGATALVFAAPGASAAGTTGTFTVTGGALTITQPATANLGNVAPGATSLSGTLGNVTVTDQRATVPDTWTATVTSTNFTTGGATTYETVTAANINYAAGLSTASSGLGAFTGALLTTGGIASPVTAGSWTGTGSNSATWDPTITFTLSPSQVAGTYTGTITHSVS